MDLQKLSISEIRGLEQGKQREAVVDIRKEIALARMEVISNNPNLGTRIKKLRKSLARLKTVQGEKQILKTGRNK